jgi:hypothetical protein
MECVGVTGPLRGTMFRLEPLDLAGEFLIVSPLPEQHALPRSLLRAFPGQRPYRL